MLSNSRQVGFGLGPIQLSEIQAYLSLYEITDPEERDAYIGFLGVCDREFLKIRAEKDEAERKVRERKGR